MPRGMRHPGEYLGFGSGRSNARELPAREHGVNLSDPACPIELDSENEAGRDASAKGLRPARRFTKRSAASGASRASVACSNSSTRSISKRVPRSGIEAEGHLKLRPRSRHRPL